jgi:hypothetical protein
MARAIVRYSFDGKDGKTIRAEIRKRLMADDLFVALGTASWESTESADLNAAIGRIRWALEVVEGSDPHALDHIWIYIDNDSVEADAAD